jgi:hypothetical protein
MLLKNADEARKKTRPYKKEKKRQRKDKKHQKRTPPTPCMDMTSLFPEIRDHTVGDPKKIHRISERQMREVFFFFHILVVYFLGLPAETTC